MKLKLVYFAGLSFLFHGLLLMPGSPMKAVLSDPMGQSLIHAELVTQSSNSRASSDRPELLPKFGKNKADKLLVSNANDASVAKHDKLSVTNSNAPSSSERNFLLGKIHTLLDKYLVYPHVARLRGWEGQVVLRFKIETDGRFNNVQVFKSSGHAVLDETAVKALTKVSNQSVNISSLRGYSTDLFLPVVYQLIES